MENRVGSFVELVAKDGYLFMDVARTNAFERILCKQSNIDEFIELPKEEALKAKEEYEKLLEKEKELRDIGGAE